MAAHSKLRVIGMAVGGLSFIAIISPKYYSSHANVLRPVLNLSWGILTGAYTVVAHYLATDHSNVLGEDAKDELWIAFSPLYGFGFTLLSCCLLVSTAGLAPDHTVLRWGSSLCVLANLLNLFWLPEYMELLEEKKLLRGNANAQDIANAATSKPPEIAEKSPKKSAEKSAEKSPEKSPEKSAEKSPEKSPEKLKYVCKDSKRYYNYFKWLHYTALISLIPYVFA